MTFEPDPKEVAFASATRGVLQGERQALRDGARALASLGLVTAGVAPSGAPASTVGFVLALAELAQARPALAMVMSEHIVASLAISQEPPSHRYTESLRGENLGCILHGRARASAVGSGWVLTGKMGPVINATDPDYALVLATDSEDSLGHYVIDMTHPRVLRDPSNSGLAFREAHRISLHLDDAPAVSRLRPDFDFDALHTLSHLATGATALGLALGCGERTRQAFLDRRLTEQALLFRLADTATDIEAARLALLEAAAARDTAGHCRLLTASAQHLALRASRVAAENALEIATTADDFAWTEAASSEAAALSATDFPPGASLDTVAEELLKES